MSQRRKSRRESERELLSLGLSPEPEMPAPQPFSAPETFRPSANVPVVDFADDQPLTRWLCACPSPDVLPRLGVQLSEALLDPEVSETAERLLAGMRPLDPRFVLAESYPDFLPALDLRALAGGTDGVCALFHAALRVDRERLVRVCVGEVGEGVRARFWLDGVSLRHGAFIRLLAGVHALVLETDSGKVRYAWQWPERRVSPRFTEVAPEDLAARHAWEHGLWERSAEAARADEAGLVRRVRIVPETVSGREGFVRVGCSENGVWWLLDADGQPFHYRAMCSVNNRGSYGGRRKGDPALPPEGVKHVLRTIRSWGFNGLGSWTTREFFDQGLYFTEIIETFYEGPYVQGGEYRYGVMPDVFDPRWARSLDRKCRRLCAPLAQSRLLVGYFLDNERGFMLTRRPDGVTGPTYIAGTVPEKRRVIEAAEPILNPEKLGLLQLVLSLGSDAPGVREGWRFIGERYGNDIRALGAAWGVDLKSRLSLNEMTVNNERLVSDAYLRDEEDFVRSWVRQYFKVSTESIRRHDPNHLIMGLRWGGPPESLILDEEVRWTDIVSMNRYQVQIVETFDAVYRRTGRPIVIGEFCIGADAYVYVHDPIEPPGGYDTDAVRHESRARESTDRISAHPGIVGYTHYAWKAGTLHPDEMRPLRTANLRATGLRAARDRALGVKRRGPLPPLHGQVFISLRGAIRDVTSLGLVCRQGVWDPEVRGNGMRGRIESVKEKGRRVMFFLRVTCSPGLFTWNDMEFSCRVTLDRVSADEMEGTFEGQSGGKPVSGSVMGYLHRPVPSVRL